MPYSVYICEDHKIVIDGVRRILEDSGRYAPIESFGSAEALMKSLEKHQPDYLILDLSLPKRSGLDILPEIRRLYPDTWILVLTMHNDPAVLQKINDAGAHGTILKDFGEGDLLQALNEVARYGRYENPRLKNLENDPIPSGVLFLTEREKELAGLVAQGKNTSEIAEILGLSPHTVNTHRKNIYKKLDISSIQELISFAHSNGL